MWFAEKESENSLHPQTVLQGCAFAYDCFREKLFLYGGRSNQPQPRMLVFDMKSSCWEDGGLSVPKTSAGFGAPSLVKAGPSLHSHVLVVHNATTIFVHGGKDQNETSCSSLFAHHVELGSWENLDGHVGGCQAPTMYGHAAVQLDPDTYLFVGIGEGRKRSRSVEDASRNQRQLSVYRLSLRPQPLWEELTCTGVAPPCRRGFSLLFRESTNTAVLAGGLFGQEIFNDVWLLNIKTNRWTQVPLATKAILSKERTILGASAVLVGDRLFVLDGNEWAELDIDTGRRKCLESFKVRSSRRLQFIAQGSSGDARTFIGRRPLVVDIDAAFVGVSAGGHVFRGMTTLAAEVPADNILQPSPTLNRNPEGTEEDEEEGLLMELFG